MQRFWSKVDKNGECWVWGGGKTGKYGVIVVNGKNIPVHRLAYMLSNDLDSIPYPTQVRHICKTPRCVRPDHLYAFTPRSPFSDPETPTVKTPFRIVKPRKKSPRKRCSYCAAPLISPRPHKIGATGIPCPEGWKPWYEHDPNAIRRGDWYMRFHANPEIGIYEYHAAHQFRGYLIIPAFSPYLTAPTHPYVWDEVYNRLNATNCVPTTGMSYP